MVVSNPKQSSPLAIDEYEPYGAWRAVPGSDGVTAAYQTPAGVSLRYRFTGKEDLTPDLTLPYTDFGARLYSPALRRWLSPDKLSEKYYDINPYVYCAGNPVNIMDKEGNKIFFVNGLKMFGSPEGGKKYWDNSFIKKSKEVLHDDNVSFLDIDHRVFSSAKQRYSNGYKYVVDNLVALSKEINKDETIKFVTHSMGAAFAEGMANAFEENDYKVNVLVHYSPYQAGDINTIGKENNVLTIDFQTRGDLVISIVSPGVVKDADYSIKRDPKASSIWYYHRESIDDSSSWDVLSGIIQEFLNTKE